MLQNVNYLIYLFHTTYINTVYCINKSIRHLLKKLITNIYSKIIKLFVIGYRLFVFNSLK